MPERKHNLADGYDWLEDQITGDVLDAIVIHPRSRGRLYLSGEWSTGNRPPGHLIGITSTDPDNTSVYTEQHELGSPDHYVVNYDVWNHRDSPTFARIVLTHPAGTQEDTPPPGGKGQRACHRAPARPPKRRARARSHAP
jgi:hypothetical protein